MMLSARSGGAEMPSTLDSSGLTGFSVPGGKLVASVSINQLTVALKKETDNDPSPIDLLFAAFPSTTSGLYVGKAIANALSVLVGDGNSYRFGALDGVPFRLWVLIFDIGDGTFALGLKNCSTPSAIFPLSEYGVASADVTASNAGLIYADAAITSRPFRIVGFLEWSSGLPTAGHWTVGPDIIQLFGPGCKKPGDVVQKCVSSSFSRSTGTTAVPADDTIPQSSEGDQYFSNTLTPTSVVNLIEHKLVFNGTPNSTAIVLASLFQDSNANAICVSWQQPVSANVPVQIVMEHIDLAGLIVPTTFKIRAGYAGGAHSFAMNGAGFCAFFGQRVQSIFATTEYMG